MTPEGKLEIYIAASWKLQHAVQMLTWMLQSEGHEVHSFVENSYEEKLGAGHKNHEDPEDWFDTDLAKKAFAFDLHHATNSDTVIYLSPSGLDAWAEVGAAYQAGVPVLGLMAKGEQIGNNRKMMAQWFGEYMEVIDFIRTWRKHFNDKAFYLYAAMTRAEIQDNLIARAHEILADPKAAPKVPILDLQTGEMRPWEGGEG